MKNACGSVRFLKEFLKFMVNNTIIVIISSIHWTILRSPIHSEAANVYSYLSPNPVNVLFSLACFSLDKKKHLNFPLEFDGLWSLTASMFFFYGKTAKVLLKIVIEFNVNIVFVLVPESSAFFVVMERFPQMVCVCPDTAWICR